MEDLQAEEDLCPEEEEEEDSEVVAGCVVEVASLVGAVAVVGGAED